MVKTTRKRTPIHRKTVTKKLPATEPVTTEDMSQTPPVQNGVPSSENEMPQNPRMYPVLHIPFNTHPNRWYAFPILGGLVKFFMILPIGIWLMLVGLWVIGVAIYNSLRVWLKGSYSLYAYTLFIGALGLGLKVGLFWSGLIDRYPGFSLQQTDLLTIEFPQAPNKLYATPIMGGFIRCLLLIPFAIYQHIIGTAANFGVLISSLPVLFMGKYPESTQELTIDGARLNLSISSYILGLSDTYPSWRISMNHKWIKVILIVIAVLYTFLGNGSSAKPTGRPSTSQQMQPSSSSAPAGY